jgi:SAM-dependent methyltransferase
MPDLAWNRRWGLELTRYARNKPVEQYGLHWGDPALTGLRYWRAKLLLGDRLPGNLSRVVARYIRPYVSPEKTVLEIGFGGGRWTHYLLEARCIILVELNPEFYPYVEALYPQARHKLEFYQTSGCELRGVASQSIDYAFSFGTFVHIDAAGIDEYISHVARVLRPGATAVIHYADKSKPFFRKHPPAFTAAFSDVTVAEMLAVVRRHELVLVHHDTRLLNHSNILVLRRPRG